MLFKGKNQLNLEIIIFNIMMLPKRTIQLNPPEMKLIKNRNMLLIIKSMDLLNTIDNERYIFIVNICKINNFYYYFFVYIIIYFYCKK